MNGNLVRQKRKEKGLAQRAVAIATGLTEATLYDIESGRIKNPTLKTMKAVADFYGVEVAELVGEK